MANWVWAATLGGSMSAITVIAFKLSKGTEDDLVRWLTGKQDEATWAKSFNQLFDGIFGPSPFTLRFTCASILASLLSVVVLFALMDNFGSLGLRARSDLSLGATLVSALAVNLVADYLSLLETRFLLRRMPRNWVLQAGVLFAGAIFSGLIIWVAIALYLRSPLYVGQAESFAEVLGLFSIFSVLFYSTFLTSVLSWGYVLSAWIMRLATRMRLASWTGVTDHPVTVLTSLLGLIVFAGALLVAAPLQKNAGGLSLADALLCRISEDRVCLKVADLSDSPAQKLSMINQLCRMREYQDCILTGRIRADQLIGQLQALCDRQVAVACTNLGYLHGEGIGTAADPAAAARLYRQGCELGYEPACSLVDSLDFD